ncbi:MAG: biopolymer transporter ExbD [Micropruina sp.]|nr:biopolymer transporter ExbD [Flavobacteriales bacterium]MBK9193559.1 biopolymer transporter ExbD [Flavobacteriales bacterium]MBP6573393.1 biopolymer transporter ExbD [Flavobacteriales bacterium]
MPKIKMPRSSPSLDMTPMVDLAFLLVTFFMLTAQFRPEDAAAVDTPSSKSADEIPLQGLLTVTVDSTGRIFWDLTEKPVRLAVLESMGARYNLTFTEDEKMRFASLGAVGMPMNKLKDFLALDNSAARNALVKENRGIPVDSVNNELEWWIYETNTLYFRDIKEKVKVALKADGNTPYTRVNEVVKTFQGPNIKINRFKMITDLEEGRL